MASADDPALAPPDVASSAKAPVGNPGQWVVLEGTKIYPDALRRLLQAEGKPPPTSQISYSAVDTAPKVPESAIIRLNRQDWMGNGPFPTLFRGRLEFPGHLHVPVVIQLNGNRERDSYEWRQLLAREMKIWPTLDHPRIVPMLGHGTFQSQTGLVRPYFGTNLESYLQNRPEPDKRRLIIQVAEGLEYLHNQRGIIHGDLRVSSVLINADGDAVLGGFRLSTSASKSPLADATMTGIRLMHTLEYAAPEILLDECCDASGKRSKTSESDIYAFGMLVYEILSGQSPWPHSHIAQVIVQVFSGLRPPRPEESQMNDFVWDLCVACWNQDPGKRPPIADILAGLRSPELPRRWQILTVDEPDAVDPFGESTRDHHGAESPVRSEYHTPELSPSDQSFHTCASWASTPLRATALIDAMDVVEEILQIEIDGAVTDIALPKQTPLKGGFGKIVKGYAQMNGAVEVYAVKISEDRNVMPRELTIWEILMHKNILPLLGALESRAGGSRKCILVSPYMKGGTLASYLKLNPLTPRLPPMIDVADGLHYLHNVKEIVHGDIKAENILIADDGRAVLADFGLSTTVSPGPDLSGLHIRQMFTLAYCAPEIIDEDAEDPAVPGVTRSKTKMSDVYAYGVLLYQIYAGGFGKTMRQRILLIGAMHEGRLPKRPFGLLHVLCDDLWSICRRCWARNAADRPPIATVLGELRDLEASPERQTLETPEPEAEKHV